MEFYFQFNFRVSFETEQHIVTQCTSTLGMNTPFFFFLLDYLFFFSFVYTANSTEIWFQFHRTIKTMNFYELLTYIQTMNIYFTLFSLFYDLKF